MALGADNEDSGHGIKLQPESLRLPLVKYLVTVLGGQDGAVPYLHEPGCQEGLTQQQNPPFLRLLTLTFELAS